MANLLVVDDERSTCEALETILRREGHSVTSVTSAEAALEYMQTQSVDCLISDVKMPGMDGLTLLRRVKSRDTGIVVVMMSGHSDVIAAVEAMKQGAFDYLIKPFGKHDVLRTVQKALTLRAIVVENLTLKRQMQDRVAQGEVIGSSPAWRRVVELVRQVAPSRATVLLSGESGTGKELIARLIHHLSPRAGKPFITLNVSALPSSLLEAELFGYEKGAFTGALKRKPGRFDLADQGTLFLDEIGEMPVDVQTKLLRVLQEGTFERLGGTQTIQVDVRIVTATNKDLVKEVEMQHFRTDLYYRLNVINVHLPPLRERPEDIPLLMHHFVRKFALQNHKQITNVQQRVLLRLQTYEWPGNVRELENVIERAVVLARGPIIGLDELPAHLQNSDASAIADSFIPPADASLAEIERAAIVHALKRSGGNRQTAARQLDIGVATLYRKLKEYNLLDPS